MTTIAVSRLEMACDSRTSWDADFHTTADKIEKIGDDIVGCSGVVDCIFEFLAWYRGDTKERPKFEDTSFEAVALTKGGIVAYHNTTYGSLVCDPFYAIGSGGMAAKAAMLCGKTPTEAVRIAIRCDKNSGGPVRSFSLKRKS